MKTFLAIFRVSTVLYGVGGSNLWVRNRVLIFGKSKPSPLCAITISASSSNFHNPLDNCLSSSGFLLYPLKSGRPTTVTDFCVDHLYAYERIYQSCLKSITFVCHLAHTHPNDGAVSISRKRIFAGVVVDSM